MLELAARMPRTVREISRAFHLGWFRAVSELRSESTRTYAGFIWWFVEPLMLLAIYYLAFSVILRSQRFLPYLFVGITAWRWFSATVTRCADSMSAGSKLMNLVYVHKSVFPFTITFVNTIKYALSLAVVAVFLAIYKIYPSVHWIALPVVLGAFFIFVMGMGTLLASITPFFPDFTLMLTSMLRAMMFLSGVVWDLSRIPKGSVAWSAVRWNPVAQALMQLRLILLDNQWPAWSSVGEVAVIGTIVLAIGLSLLSHWNWLYPKLK
jgi:lipopolysaccharide transport system permease protein